jgi:dTDP-4-amino-4,6-dideoxygalactose transaminase
LSGVKGIKLVANMPRLESNCSYFPILIKDDYPLTRDELYEKLKAEGIFARRYFYPLISESMPFKDYPSSGFINLKKAKDTSNRVLCLPIHPDLKIIDIEKILGFIK